MTRARERLILTACRRRRIAGRYQDQLESPFVMEVPGNLLQVTESPSLFQRGGAPSDRLKGVYSFFGQEREAARPDGWKTQRSQAGGAGGDSGSERGIRRGSRVEHPVLGEGVVLSLEGSGDQAKFTVYFDKAGKKKLMAKYANLELL
jgi:DNA helicase-2/ATP-dependent DNA helicase PcrA